MEKPDIAQIKEEFDVLLKFVPNKKLIMEIGTGKGGALYEMMQVADNNAEFVSVDIRDYEMEYPSIETMQSWCKEGQKLSVIIGDSTSQDIINQVKKILNGRKFDFLFIDGNHDYEYVQKDYENYGEMTEGLIAFHDIVHGFHPGFLFDEIKGSKVKIIHDLNQDCMGIGLLYERYTS